MAGELKIRQTFHFGTSGIVTLAVDSCRAEDWQASIELAQRLTEAVEKWKWEDPPEDPPSDTPAGPETPQERPTEWNPMATCPRGPDGRLTEDVWIGYDDGMPHRWERGDFIKRRDDDGAYRRVGWLPGHLKQADLPPVEVTP